MSLSGNQCYKQQAEQQRKEYRQAEQYKQKMKVVVYLLSPKQ